MYRPSGDQAGDSLHVPPTPHTVPGACCIVPQVRPVGVHDEHFVGVAVRSAVDRFPLEGDLAAVRRHVRVAVYVAERWIRHLPFTAPVGPNREYGPPGALHVEEAAEGDAAVVRERGLREQRGPPPTRTPGQQKTRGVFPSRDLGSERVWAANERGCYPKRSRTRGGDSAPGQRSPPRLWTVLAERKAVKSRRPRTVPSWPVGHRFVPRR